MNLHVHGALGAAVDAIFGIIAINTGRHIPSFAFGVSYLAF